MSSETFDPPAKCPNCGRAVEAGFRFCDHCGSKLEPGPLRTQAPERKDPGERPDTQPDTQPHVEKERWKPLLERRRERRRERKAAAEREAAAERAAAAETKAAERPSTVPEPTRPATPTAPPTAPPPAGPRITSKPMKAEELRAEQHRVAIGGRLQWKGETASQAAAPPAPESPAPEPRWRRAGPPGERPEPSTRRYVLVFVVHLVLAFAAGAALLAVAAIVASLMSNGRVALLEVRGLPIFVAGATAIIVFSLFRTSPRAKGRRSAAVGVLVGFILLVAAVTLVYRPALMAPAQKRLDQALGVFGPHVSEAVERYHADVDQWNAEVDRYKTEHLTTIVRNRETETDAEARMTAEERFRIEASRSEEALDGILKRMRSHADAIEHPPLRDALRDLTAVFGDELSGIHLITRGFVNDDQGLISSGDTRFKDATDRAVELFDERVRPILERGDIDADPLAASIADLRG